MWEYNYTTYPDELYHYGVVGMKWGTHKATKQDNKIRRQLKRQLASDKRNVKMRSKMLDTASYKHEAAKQNYRKALSKNLSRWTSFWDTGKSYERIKEADAKIKESRAKLENSKKEYDKAVKGYDSKEKEYKSQVNKVNKMMKKYGSKKVYSLSTKHYKMGETRTKKMLKTGLTISDLPFIGRKTSSKYIVNRDYRNV